ncbi:MAG: ABC transporter ATP-binding protein [Actinobacteria bacterium]|nr:ABC transporter ATP-binding protein [Actinomycetota bacterium]
MSESILSIKDLNSYYGKSHVLQDVSININPLERVAILGRNGMGKSTLMKSILGLGGIRRDGNIYFNDENIIKKKTYEIARRGIAYVPQGRQLFSLLSVEEHLAIAYKPVKGGNGWTPKMVFDIFPEIGERKKISGTKLSGGEQQILAIGRALVKNPSLILMDEPSEGISTLVLERILGICHRLTKQGITLFLVEQNLGLALSVAQKVYILVNGRIVHEASAEEFNADKESQHNFLGI